MSLKLVWQDFNLKKNAKSHRVVEQFLNLLTEELRTQTDKIHSYVANLKSMRTKETEWLKEVDSLRETVQSQARDIDRLRLENEELKVRIPKSRPKEFCFEE